MAQTDTQTHTHRQTDMATLWPTRPSGAELVKMLTTEHINKNCILFCFFFSPIFWANILDSNSSKIDPEPQTPSSMAWDVLWAYSLGASTPLCLCGIMALWIYLALALWSVSIVNSPMSLDGMALTQSFWVYSHSLVIFNLFFNP